MRVRASAALGALVAFGFGLLAGCMAGGPATQAQPPAAPAAASAAAIGVPLVLDPADVALGLTAEYTRIPTASELSDLALGSGLQHVVVALDQWPTDFDAVRGLNQLPEGSDAIVVLHGYPPSREAANAWNYVSANVRIVALVDGPPPSLAVIDDLNTMRHLERVIAQTPTVDRRGFERLQRPLGFRRIFE
jgi:hypothetical protein